MPEHEPGGRRGRVQSAMQLDCGQHDGLKEPRYVGGNDLPAPVVREDVTAG